MAKTCFVLCPSCGTDCPCFYNGKNMNGDEKKDAIAKQDFNNKVLSMHLEDIGWNKPWLTLLDKND